MGAGLIHAVIVGAVAIQLRKRHIPAYRQLRLLAVAELVGTVLGITVGAAYSAAGVNFFAHATLIEILHRSYPIVLTWAVAAPLFFLLFVQRHYDLESRDLTS